MSFLLCPRAGSRPLLGLALRASGPAKSTKARPSCETLRWLSSARANPHRARCLRLSQRQASQAPCAIAPLAYPSGRRTFFSRRRVPKKYEQLPDNYRDEDGLDFRTEELSQDEVDRVFRRGSITADDANDLLRILHGRRVAGTLEDPQYTPNTTRFPQGQIDTALEYLRITVPVDEALNAGLRAEDELAQIEKEEQLKEQGKPSEPDSRFYKADPVYGENAFDKIRARNEAKNQAKADAREAARKARERAEEEAAGGPLALAKARAGPVALVNEEGKNIVNPKIAEYYKEAQAQGKAEPEMVAFWQRVLPSATLVTLVIGFLAAVTTVYEEPADAYRMFSGMSTAQATVCALVGANVLVWLAWKMPPLWGLMNRYMVFVVGVTRPVTLLTANFSHQSLSHLATNMVPLYFLGLALHNDMDRASFLTLYMACGAAGYLCSLVVYTLRGWLSVSSLGASGSTLGIVTAYFWAHRGDGFKFLGMPEEGVHGIVFLALLAAIQISYLGRAVRSRVDLASHIGGMGMGIFGMELLDRRRKGMMEEKRREAMKGKNSAVPGVEVKEEEGGRRRSIDVLGGRR
ncbi:rhomboid family protein [Sarocladium implicatum]|nr:rhomboid family protein [Sarocladium implicatum]